MKLRITPAVKPQRKRLVARVLSALAAGGLAWAALAHGVQTETGGPAAADAAPVAGEAPGYAVEDFAYPQADKILAEQGIVL
ncbi:hypothetical protein ABT085_45350, partial [Streptomyces sp. NPDC002265]